MADPVGGGAGEGGGGEEGEGDEGEGGKAHGFGCWGGSVVGLGLGGLVRFEMFEMFEWMDGGVVLMMEEWVW